MVGRPQRFATAGTIWAFAFVLSYLSSQLFQPGSLLRQLTGDVGDIGSQSASALHADIHAYLTLWIPLGLVAFGFAWLVITEYRDQRVAEVVPFR